jgi:hypothetical protein
MDIGFLLEFSSFLLDCCNEAFLLDFVGVKHFCFKWNNFSIFVDIVQPSFWSSGVLNHD